MSHSFRGKTVMISGGNCTLALCLAELLMDQGLFTILGYRSETGKSDIDQALHPRKGCYQTCELDFSRIETLHRAINDLREPPDYLVDFAQGNYETLLASADDESMATYISENITHKAIWLKRISRAMIKKKFGRLVFVSSAAASRPSPGQGLYASSKLAVEALYRSMALELEPFGISSVSIRPGYVDSGRGKTFIQKSAKKVKSIAPHELAQTLLFLLSDAALGINGTELVIDSGLTAGKHIL